MRTRSIGLFGILGGLAVGQAGVLDFLPDLRGGADSGPNACTHGLKFVRSAQTGGTITVPNRRSTRQAQLWRGTEPCCAEEYDRTKLNMSVMTH